MRQLAVLALSLVFCCFGSCFAQAAASRLQRSPNTVGEGYFIQLQPYEESRYGPMPNHISSLRSPEWNSIRDGSNVRAQLRQKTHDFRVALMEWMQADVLDALHVTLQENGVQEAAFETRSFWIDQSIYVRPKRTFQHVISGAHLQSMLARTFDSHPHVLAVEENRVVAQIVDPVEMVEPDVSISTDSLAWGVEKVRAQEAWAYTRGQGIRVAAIDTGTMFTHEVLRDSYGGGHSNPNPNPTPSSNTNTTSPHDYFWFDPLEFRNDEWWCTPGICSPKFCCLDEPFDNVGHGTHVMGSIAGSRGIGVAPAVEWMSAKGCRDGSCLRYGLTAAAEWVVCPSRIDGTEKDCSRGADIISNSWGSQDPNDNFYQRYVEVWREAGQIPVFANGNNGPQCGMIGAPGDFRNVIGVGATDRQDQLAKFSSRGPGPYQSRRGRRHNSTEEDPLFARFKPDFSAPGVKVYSAYVKNDSSYMLMSGTSMATPHVSGIIALVLSLLDQQQQQHSKQSLPLVFQANAEQQPPAPSANLYDRVYAILKQAATQDVGKPLGGGGVRLPIPGFPTRWECDHVAFDVWPNLFYGWGRLDALKAVQVAASA